MEIKDKLQELIRFRQIKHWYEKYERILLPAMLVFGIATDMLAFTRIDTPVVFSILGVYLVVSGCVIFFINAYDAKRITAENFAIRYLRLAAPLLIQFLFGALLNGVFIFYFFSGTLYVSWPFLVLLVALMISNDVFRRYYLRPLVQTSVYFFIVFSYLSIILPFVFNSLNIKLFVWSGIASLAFISLYLWGLSQIVTDIRRRYVNFVTSIIIIFAFINGLYFFNLIPPIPLSIREVALSSGVVRNGGEYTLQVQETSWWTRFFSHQSFQRAEGEGLSVYTAIFAPKNFQAKVIHHWQWYDEVQNKWVSKDKLTFTLSGGRKEGFRAYSTKTNVLFGAWRVDVETERGQVLGRVRFDVVPVKGDLQLKEVVR